MSATTFKHVEHEIQQLEVKNKSLSVVEQTLESKFKVIEIFRLTQQVVDEVVVK